MQSLIFSEKLNLQYLQSLHRQQIFSKGTNERGVPATKASEYQGYELSLT